MTRSELLALAGVILVVSLIGPTMTLFHRAGAGQAATASPATTRLYRYRDCDGRMHDLAYDDLPVALGRWGYQTQTSPSFSFAFDLERVDGIVRIYIAEQPSYGSREDGLVVTHRHADGERRYICIGNASPPVDGREAATWFVYWAELSPLHPDRGALLVTPAALRALLLGTAPAEPPTITIDPAAWRLYRESIAHNVPEEVALIAGRLDDPLHITDFYFMPPPREGGRFAHGASHVALDAMAMNYVIDRVLVPNDKYILGIWHSHPGGYSTPSEADRRLCAAILRNDDSPGRRWPFFLAPITTFDADGRDRVSAWVMRKGTDAFEPALFEPPVPVFPLAAPLPVPAISPLVATPAPAAPPATADAAPADPLVADMARLVSLLGQPDGLVGIPRYRAGLHLHAALRIAERGGAEPRP